MALLSIPAAPAVAAPAGLGQPTFGAPVLRFDSSADIQITVQPSLSGDGRLLAFQTDAPLLTPDTAGQDVFLSPAAGVVRRVYTDRQVSGGGDGASGPRLSRDGHVLAFVSASPRLLPGDTNGAADVFVKDLRSGAITRVSVSSAGQQGNGDSGGDGSNGSDAPTLSADGRYVAFASLASNLVPGDTNGAWDVFLHDRQTGRTERVSVDSRGRQGNGHSGEHAWTRIAFSGNARYVAFDSAASNLVPGDTNQITDVFLRDRRAGTTERVSVGSAGQQAIIRQASDRVRRAVDQRRRPVRHLRLGRTAAGRPLSRRR